MGVVMSRGTAVAMAFVVAGSLGTAMMGQWDAFSIGFFFLFWGGLAAAITWIAGGRGNADQADVLPISNHDKELPIPYPNFNPATGLPTRGGMDDGGNTCGTRDAFDAVDGVHHPHSGAHGGL
jgi:hypothetical protein